MTKKRKKQVVGKKDKCLPVEILYDGAKTKIVMMKYDTKEKERKKG